MNFSEALVELKAGKALTRQGWNGTGMFIKAQFPDENSANTRPYLFILCPAGSTKQFNQDGLKNEKDERIPWLCSQTDMFADDWILVA